MIGAIQAVPRFRTDAGPAFFRQGFRPFFLGAGVWAVAAVAAWLAAFRGLVSIPTAFDPVTWHAHELVFGFVAAAIAGFLLTAVPNWTGRRPIQGVPLAVLFVLWVIGRAAVGASGLIGPGVAAPLDLAFLALLLGTVLREIVAARNWRNVPITVALAALLLANVLVHAEAIGYASTGPTGQRLGIAVVVLLISLVGGRIIPSFTANWLKKRGEGRMPAGQDALDLVALAVLLVALGVWVAAPQGIVTGASLIVAGAFAAIRLARWRGHRTLSEPLLWSLHLGFAWVPAGLLLTGSSLVIPSLPVTTGIHALTAGAMGSMTLAVMTRATLGHTGRALTADRWTAAIYIFVTAAAVLRVAAPLLAEAYLPLLWAAGVAWIAAFGTFAVRYGRLLVASEPRA
jgi:uncharacterized protein involved in response to NO